MVVSFRGDESGAADARIARTASPAFRSTAAISDRVARATCTPATTTAVTPRRRASSLAMDRASSSSLWPVRAKTDVVALRRPGRARLGRGMPIATAPMCGTVSAQAVHAQPASREEAPSPTPGAARARRERHAAAIRRLGDRTPATPETMTPFRRRAPPTFAGRRRFRRAVRPRGRGHGDGAGGACVPVHSRTRSWGMRRRSRIRPTVWFTISSSVVGRS